MNEFAQFVANATLTVAAGLVGLTVLGVLIAGGFFVGISVVKSAQASRPIRLEREGAVRSRLRCDRYTATQPSPN